MKTIAIMIGNSDNKLTQNEWSHFAAYVHSAISRHVLTIHFRGGSDWDAPWQNACWVCTIEESAVAGLKDDLAHEAKNARQDSTAVLMGDVEFVESRTKSSEGDSFHAP